MNANGSPTVDRVMRGQLCAGCGLCASVSRGAIAMQLNASGYSRPVQHSPVSGEAEAIIASTCPGAVVAPWDQTANPHPVWGPLRRVATGSAVAEPVRFEGSSGGALSALLIQALETGTVDRVVHVVADPNDPIGNLISCSRTPEEVLAGAGSRYTASSPLIDIDQILAEGGRLAFVGKPCDVSALRRLAEVDPRVDRHVPLMFSFFCGGMPSRNGVSRILDAMEIDQGELVSFRYRGRGWPGRATATTRTGRVGDMSYEESWGGYLAKDVQFRCKICPDAVGGVADIACADAWYGGEAGYPTFEEQAGRSLIIARSEVGLRFLESAVEGCALEVEPLNPSEIDLMQPSQARRKRLVRARVAALQLTGRPTLDARGTLVGEASRAAGLGESVHNFLGAVRRIFTRRS